MNINTIYYLIKRYREGVASDEERKTLLEWYRKKADRSAEFPDSEKAIKDAMLNRLLAEIKPKRGVKIFKRLSIAASILLFLVAGVFYAIKDKGKDQVAKNNTMPIDIHPGSDKAILTLEDGSEFALGKGSAYQTENAKSSGENIEYRSNSEKSSKIVYNYLTIPRGGKFFIKLSDGTKVWLNSESQLKFPVSFIPGETRAVELVYGEAYFEVSPSTAHGGDNFKVLNQFQVVKVVGTQFNIKAYKGDSNLYTTLVEGKVILDNGIIKHNLLPNQQSNLNLKSGNITIKTVDVNPEISWVKGLFTFKEMSLKEIMKVISRWYNVDVVFKNKDLENVKFKGTLSRDQDIEEILSIMKSTTIKSYEIKNRTIFIK
ncbi:FecR family protein [Pedobacter sp. Du54]|uniref:FecR family protein n=1 Tax=Pedobacter anseongensis TaxID=3133439 RepID=UPI0030B27FB7